MLERLARWLRAAGHDTASAAAGESDGAVLARAIAENRLLLTRDARMLERRAARGRVFLLRGNGVEAWVAELAALGLDWRWRPFSRCLLCNTVLVSVPPDCGREAPPHAPQGSLRQCPRCGKLYWSGSHVRRMEARLKAWRAQAGHDW